MRLLSLGIGIACLWATAAFGQSDDLPPPPHLTIADWFSPEYRGSPNTRGNTVVTRGYFPWRWDGLDMLARVSIPYTTSSPGKIAPGDTLINDFPSGPAGLGDVEIYNLAQWKWGAAQWSLGPVFSLPTGTHSGVGKGKWTAGPAGGIRFTDGNWTFGTFSQNFFSFAGSDAASPISKVKIQPIVDLSLDDGWSVGTSDMNFTYDWVKGGFSNIPAGLQVAKAFTIGVEPVNVAAQIEYNFATGPGASAWTFRLTWQFQLPRFY